MKSDLFALRKPCPSAVAQDKLLPTELHRHVYYLQCGIYIKIIPYAQCSFNLPFLEIVDINKAFGYALLYGSPHRLHADIAAHLDYRLDLFALSVSDYPYHSIIHKHHFRGHDEFILVYLR